MSEHVHGIECEPKSGDILCLIPGPTEVLKREDAGIKWCFQCRAHLPHEHVLLADPFDPDDPSTYSYYDPIWVTKCSRCHQDHTQFPGTVY